MKLLSSRSNPSTVILGGGISGAIASTFFPDAIILEKRPEASSSSIFSTTFYAHRKVPVFAEEQIEVSTEILPCTCIPICNLMEAYSEKVYGDPKASSSIDKFLGKATRYKWSQEALGLAMSERIYYRHEPIGIYADAKRMLVSRGEGNGCAYIEYERIISTIPLYALVSLAPGVVSLREGKKITEGCKFAPIYLTIENGLEKSSSMKVTYCPCRKLPYYRISETNGRRTYESLTPPREKAITLSPGKIWPNPLAEAYLKELEKWGIFCVGRYARWEKGFLSHRSWEILERVYGKPR